MAETDITFRRLVRDLPRPLLQLAFPGYPIEPCGPFDPSVDRPRQQTSDNLIRVRDGTGDVAAHFEIERDWRPSIPPRLFKYASHAAAAVDLPVWTIVVLLRPGGKPPKGVGVYRLRGIGGDAFTYRYRVISLWELDARQMLDQLGLTGAPYCIAMDGADEDFVCDIARRVMTDPALSEGDRENATMLLSTVASAIFGVTEARRIIDMGIMENPNVRGFYKTFVDEGRQEGLKEGRAKGRQEGKEEGRAEHARATLYKVLAARSFSMGTEARARIDSEGDIARLEAWFDAALVAASIDDVFRSH